MRDRSSEKLCRSYAKIELFGPQGACSKCKQKITKFSANFRRQGFFTIWKYFDLFNLFQLCGKVLLYPDLSENIYRISRSGSEKRGNGKLLNPSYTVSSVFCGLLIPFKVITKFPTPESFSFLEYL